MRQGARGRCRYACMAFARRFEDLEIWRQAQDLAVRVYRCFGAKSAAVEAHDYEFVAQVRSAAVSVSNNIAEGFEAGTRPEFARFLRIAKRSCGEVRNMLHLAVRFGYMPEAAASDERGFAEALSRGIAAFIRKL